MKSTDPADWQQDRFSNDGITLRFIRTGEGVGPPVILLHGLTDNGFCCYRAAVGLAGDHDVIMLDARNHGLSDGGPAGAHQLASDVSSLIDHLELSSVTVIGHSVGAAVAATFAADFPQQATQIILEDPPWRESSPTPDPEKAEKQKAQFAAYVQMLQSKTEADIIAMGKKDHPSWHEDDLPAWAQSKRQVREDATASLDLGDWTTIVPSIQCPVVLIYGDQENGCDGIVTPEVAMKVTDLNSQFRSEHVAGAGHNLRREQFESYITVVREFLKEK